MAEPPIPARRSALGRLRPYRAAAILSFLGLAVLVVGWWVGGAVLDIGRFSTCKSRLRQIGIGLHNYHDQYGCFPPAATYGPDGRAWHSWRVLILPHLGLNDAPQGYRFDEPWDSPANLVFARSGGAGLYRCPSDTGAEAEHTSYLAVVGDRTMWPPNGRPATIRGARDGTSNTILLVESAGSCVTWTEPRDLRFEEMPFAVNADVGLGIRGRHRSGMLDGKPWAFVLFGDASFHPWTADVPLEIVRSAVLRDDGGPTDWNGL